MAICRLYAAPETAAHSETEALRVRKRHKSAIPAELLAPMTTEVEQQLRKLIKKHGIENLRDALMPLIAKCRFSDC